MVNILKLRKDQLAVLTVDDLTQAIKNSIDRRGMKESEAREMAHHVMNFFGYSERIIDNCLEPPDRDVFYMLEDAGILKTEREETTLYDGREWRMHFWLWDRYNMKKLFKEIKEMEYNEDTEAEDLYMNNTPDSVWENRNAR